MRKNELKTINHYYVTYDPTQKWIGEIKPGTSQQTKLNDRMNRLHVDEPYMKLAGYITITNTHKARLEALEHNIKADLVDAGFEHYGNDHFKFKFDRKGKRQMQYKILANVILYKAMEYCEKYHLKYTVTWIG